VNRRQRAGAVQHRELRGIASIRRDPIARSSRNQGRRDHVAGDALRLQIPLYVEPTGPRFIAAPNGRRREPLEKASDGRQIRRQRLERRRPIAGQEDGRHH
jgi:hypothetical protein